MEIDWTEQAIRDLAEIQEYIERERPQAAQRVASHLLATVEHLAEFPELGSAGPRPGTRTLTVPPYAISYRVRRDRLEILSIWDGRRRHGLTGA